MRKLFVLVVVLAAVAAACACDGGSDVPEPTPINGDAASDADGTCLAGDEDCADNPATGDEPPAPLDDDGAPIAARGLSVSEVLATPIDGSFAIYATYFEDESGARLCDALAESFPPQCPSGFIPVDTSAVDIATIASDAGLMTEQGVTWTNDALSLIGSVVDGVFVLDADQNP